jgi:putative ABC transport system permease protein
MGPLASDLRWSVRLIRRRPAFATTIVLTLAAAIAGVTTSMAVATSVLWRPLPFARAERLVFAWENTGTNGGTAAARVTPYRFTQWERGTRALSSMAAFGAVGFLADRDDGPTMVDGVRVTTNYFATLGIAPALGRDFTSGDGDPGAPRVVILSHGLWRDWFGSRPDAIGTDIRLGGVPYAIVGVMPDVVFPAWPENPAVVTLDPSSRRLWVPIARTSTFAASARGHVLGVVARLADGRSREDAAAELSTLAAAADPDAHGGLLRPFREQFVGDARVPLVALLCAALAVLLIAATNLAALQASAMEGRRAELSVRAALGAGRFRLAQQLGIEAAMLAVGGAACGIAVSAVTLSRVPSMLPPSVPLLTPPAVDGRTLLAAGAVSLCAALALAAWPFVRVRDAVSPAPRGGTPLARSRTFRGLVGAQVAMAMALVSAAALLQQSLGSVRRQRAGFTIDNVLVAPITLAGNTYNATTNRVVDTEQEMTEALSRLPGTTAVAFAYDHPLAANWLDSFTISGSAAGRDDLSGSAQLRIVSPSYFTTLGVRIVSGRGFTEHEDYAAGGVALVNQAFADRLLDGPALDRRLESGSTAGARPDVRLPSVFRIIGVVANERFKGLEAPTEPAVYVSTRQFPQQELVLLMHTGGEPLSVAQPVRRAIHGIDPGVPVGAITTLSAILAEQMVARRATTQVLTSFAAGALTLAAIGVYGLLALLVASGVRETGIRLALGSSPAQEATRVLQRCVGSVGGGVVCGVGLALVAGRLLQTLLVDVSSHDVRTLAETATVITLVACASAAVPALQAARIDPSAALRR